MPNAQQTAEKVMQMWKTASESITRKEFVDSFAAILKQIVALEKGLTDRNREILNKAIDELWNELEQTKKKQENEIQQLIQETTQKLNKSFSKQEETLNFVRDKANSLKNGKTPTRSELTTLIEEIIPPMPVMPEIPPPDTPEEVRNKLESLQEDERLDKSSIRGLEDEIKKLRDEITNIPKGRGGSRGKIPVVRAVYLTDQCDGSTKAFTLPKDTVRVISIQGTQFPVIFDSADFTLSGNTVTLASGITAPASGQTLVAMVETLFYA